MRSSYIYSTVNRIRIVLMASVACALCCFAGSVIAQPTSVTKGAIGKKPVTTSGKSTPKQVPREGTETRKALSKASIVKAWRCVSKQPMMEMDAKESFSDDQTAKGEGRLTFSWTDGTKLDLFLESTSRWRIDGDTLCDVPTSMHFTQMSGQLNPHVDQLMAAMQAQADKRMASNLETCKRIKSLTDTELVLALPSPQGEVETRCTPAQEVKDEK
jgi:hypothetical protein